MSRPGYERILAKRALLTALGPLAGTRATGHVTAVATGVDVELPAFTYGIPVDGAKAVPSRMVKTLEPVTVTAAGVDIPVRAVMGGVDGNIAAGSTILWQPLPAGIEARGLVAVGGITGGAATPGPGRAARVVAFDAIQAGMHEQLWRATGTGYPAIVVARMGSQARGGGPRTVKSISRVHNFRIYVIATNYADHDERQGEGELLLDEIEHILEGLCDVDGEVFSGPPVTTGNETASFTPSSHVYTLDVTVTYALSRTDVRLSDGVSWQPWETTRMQVAEPETATQDAHTMADVTVEHEQ